MVEVQFHKTNVIRLSYFTSRPCCWWPDRFARAADIDSAQACTLPHFSTANAALSLEDRTRSLASCGRLPAGRTRRAASRLSQGLSDSNLGRDPTLGYEDDRMRGGEREGITLYDTSRLVSGQSRRGQ